MQRIDLNADLGESYGAFEMGNDAELMQYVSSVNIACGFHAGDFSVMYRTVSLAKEKGVAIGAHPGFPDLQGFGRRTMQFSPEEIYAMVLYQIAALAGFTQAVGIQLHHIKPHGALYNKAAQDAEWAKAIAQAVRDFDESLILYGLSGSYLITEAEKIGLQTASEVFADRTYQADGYLTPRSQPNALIHSKEDALKQVLQMIRTGTVRSTNGQIIPIKAETVCLHGDNPMAVDFASYISEALKNP
jgi:UPF0271 protein